MSFVSAILLQYEAESAQKRYALIVKTRRDASDAEMPALTVRIFVESNG